ncbi:MAG: LolA family protein [Beutenbergiaceae bacterium]
MNRRSLRWAVPGAVAAAVVAAIAIPSLATADQTPDLDALDPQELLIALAEAEPAPLSGTAVYTARLGLPELTGELTQGADPMNLLDGSSTIRVWTDGESRSRIALLGATSEYSVVTDGEQAWSYASETNEVRHITLDAASQQQLAQAQQDRDAAAAAGDIPTPQAMAEQVLEDAEQYADVTMADPIMVASRAAYQMVIDPNTADTLVEQIIVAIDGETFAPLSVQVWSTEDAVAPAIELAFTDISYEMPSDAALAFSTPSGATVTESEIDLSEYAGTTQQDHTEGETPEGVTVTGSGFATVVEKAEVDIAGLLSGDPSAMADAAAEAAEAAGTDGPSQDMMDEFGGPDGIDTQALYDELTTPVDGGRLLTTTLVSILFTDDGRVLAGAVPPEVLLSTAGLA